MDNYEYGPLGPLGPLDPLDQLDQDETYTLEGAVQGILNEMSQLQIDNVDKESKLNSAKSTIHSLESAVSMRDSAIHDLLNELEERDAVIQGLRRELVEADTETNRRLARAKEARRISECKWRAYELSAKAEARVKVAEAEAKLKSSEDIARRNRDIDKRTIDHLLKRITELEK
jgi:chromosome segregation ATPase